MSLKFFTQRNTPAESANTEYNPQDYVGYTHFLSNPRVSGKFLRVDILVVDDRGFIAGRYRNQRLGRSSRLPQPLEDAARQLLSHNNTDKSEDTAVLKLLQPKGIKGRYLSVEPDWQVAQRAYDAWLANEGD